MRWGLEKFSKSNYWGDGNLVPNRRIQSLVMGGAISEKYSGEKNFSKPRPFLKLLECCVKSSVHFPFIFMSNLCGMSLEKFLRYEILPFGGHGPQPPLYPQLVPKSRGHMSFPQHSKIY